MYYHSFIEDSVQTYVIIFFFSQLQFVLHGSFVSHDYCRVSNEFYLTSVNVY